MGARLYTLGHLALERGGAPVTGGAVQRRRLALLALLAASGEGGLTREKVVGFLWAEHSPRRARSTLAESLFVLRRALGRAAIMTAGDYVRLNPGELWTDVGAFQAGIAAGAFQEAVGVYGGTFLDGFYVKEAPEFEQWTGRQQDRLARDMGRALELLAEQAAAAHDPLGAAEWWRRLAEHDPFSVRVAFRYVEALVRAGEPVRALHFATELTARIRRELGIEPEASVVEFARALIAGAPGGAAPPRGFEAVDPGQGPAALPPLLRPAHGLEGLDPELEVIGVIGEGSVAQVYLARERPLRRLVAVKVLSAALAGAHTARARFEREARAAASIQHPNVAPVYRTGRLANGSPYLVMPYFHGGSLEARLGTGPLPLDDARRYLGQMAAGLAAAHRLGIVHRDVRPANVLYDRETHRVVLIDFGVAAVLDEPRLTLPGERLGNPVYASPEQLRGEDVTDRSDVYSLGVVAFEMLTGRPPTQGTAVEVMRTRAGSPAPRLRELRPELPADLDDLVSRCFHPRPAERPSASEVAEAVTG